MMINNESWFVGKDVAMMLGYVFPRRALYNHVDEEDKTTVLIQHPGSNYKSKTIFINESGLYALILSSKLPQAKEFKRWVTNEVLPQLRKTGGYIPVSYFKKAYVRNGHKVLGGLYELGERNVHRFSKTTG